MTPSAVSFMAFILLVKMVVPQIVPPILNPPYYTYTKGGPSVSISRNSRTGPQQHIQHITPGSGTTQANRAAPGNTLGHHSASDDSGRHVGIVSGWTGQPGEPLERNLEQYFQRVVNAIYIIEGGEYASYPFGIRSVYCGGYYDCRRIALKTVRNYWQKWVDAGMPSEFIEYLGKGWAPLDAENDPLGLNANWIPNLKWQLERDKDKYTSYWQS